MSHPIFLIPIIISIIFIFSNSISAYAASNTEHIVILSENLNLGEQDIYTTGFNIENTIWQLTSVFLMMVIGLLLIPVMRLFSFNDVNITNVEERAKKLQGKGMEHFLKKTKAELIDRSKRGNELYEIKMFRTYRLKWLKYEDPSTVGKIYGCFVPSEMTKADEAMAWKFQITEEEYDGMEIEA